MSLYVGVGSTLIGLAADMTRMVVTEIENALPPPRTTTKQPEPPMQNGTGSTVAPGSLGCLVTTKRPSQVTLDLYVPAPQGFVPFVHALYPGDGKSDAIRDITFAAGQAQTGAVLRIVVPDGQPPGIYTGAVVDVTTGEPGGCLILRLF